MSAKLEVQTMLYELLGGVLGWAWLGSTAAAFVFAGLALFGDGSWWHTLYAVIAGAVAKPLSAGFFEAQAACQARLAANTASDSDFLEAAQALVNQYGAVLGQHAGRTSSEELLPASKSAIKAALVAVARATKAQGELTPDALNALRHGYGSLADFVPSAEAERARRVYAAADEAPANLTNKEDLLEVAQKMAEVGEDGVPVGNLEEYARLVEEFDESLRSSHEGGMSGKHDASCKSTQQ